MIVGGLKERGLIAELYVLKGLIEKEAEKR